MIKLNEEIKGLENTLEWIELLDYDGYIGDVISEVANSNIDIYNATLFEKGFDLYAEGWIEEAKNNQGDFPCIIDWLQAAQFEKYTSEIYSELDDIILLGIYRELEELGLEEIEEGYLYHDIYNNSLLSEIEERAEEIFEEYKEDKENID